MTAPKKEHAIASDPIEHVVTTHGGQGAERSRAGPPRGAGFGVVVVSRCEACGALGGLWGEAGANPPISNNLCVRVAVLIFEKGNCTFVLKNTVVWRSFGGQN